MYLKSNIEVSNFSSYLLYFTSHKKNLKQQNKSKSASEYTHWCLQNRFLKAAKAYLPGEGKSLTWTDFDKNPETKPAQK